jgi:hypothetical protein
VERPEAYAVGDVNRPYRSYCTDIRGELVPYGQVLETNARFYVESQGVTAARGDCGGARDARGHAGVARSALRQEQFGERKFKRRRELCLITSS